MDRIDQTYTAAYTETLRQQYVGGADGGADDDLPPEDRPNRVDRSDLGALKDDDDVEVSSGTHVRVVCPGRGRGWFYCWWYEAMFRTWMVGQMEAVNVTDRAPADPDEEPMPIFPEPEPPA